MAMLFMCISSFGILNGLIGIFGSAFRRASREAFSNKTLTISKAAAGTAGRVAKGRTKDRKKEEPSHSKSSRSIVSDFFFGQTYSGPEPMVGAQLQTSDTEATAQPQRPRSLPVRRISRITGLKKNHSEPVRVRSLRSKFQQGARSKSEGHVEEGSEQKDFKTVHEASIHFEASAPSDNDNPTDSNALRDGKFEEVKHYDEEDSSESSYDPLDEEGVIYDWELKQAIIQLREEVNELKVNTAKILELLQAHKSF